MKVHGECPNAWLFLRFMPVVRATPSTRIHQNTTLALQSRLCGARRSSTSRLIPCSPGKPYAMIPALSLECNDESSPLEGRFLCLHSRLCDFMGDRLGRGYIFSVDSQGVSTRCWLPGFCRARRTESREFIWRGVLDHESL